MEVSAEGEMEVGRGARFHADTAPTRREFRLSPPWNRTVGMKQRIRSWAFVSTALALGIAVIFLIWIAAREKNSGEGESSPQFTTPPGVSSPSLQVWGEPNRSLFAPISPRYVDGAEAASFLIDGDRVYLLRRGSTTYVFPEVLLTSFHVVNDVMDGEPVAITYCLLAGSSSLFSRKVEDRVLTFGLTGQLYAGNSVLYDKETSTDWLQLNGEPLRGHYYGKARLSGRSLERSTWSRVKARPNLKVLAPIRDMEEYRSFQRDMEREQFGKKVVESQTTLDSRLLPYTRGLGIVVQGEPRFYPMDIHGPRTIQEDRVGGWNLLVLQDGTEDIARIFRRRVRDRVLDFDLVEGGLRDRQTSSRWDDDGVCIEGPLAGARLELPACSEAYWFAWASLYPDTHLLP